MRPCPERAAASPVPVCCFRLPRTMLPGNSPPSPSITVSLRPHPGTAFPTAAERVLVTLSATPDGGARFSFVLEADRIDQVLLPPPAEAEQADRLWQHSCFEVFLAVADAPAYREYNFSPSGQWAVYAFRQWREADPGFVAPCAPVLHCERNTTTFRLDAYLPAALLPPHAGHDTLQVGLAAVIEDPTGKLEYWALRHDGEQPDFHARSSFSLVLPLAQPSAPSPT